MDLEETIKQYQRDSSLPSIAIANAEDHDRIFNRPFDRAWREAQDHAAEPLRPDTE